MMFWKTKISIIAAFFLLISSSVSLADPQNVPFWAVDINGAGGPVQTAAPEGWPDWPAWYGWEFAFSPTGGPSWSNTFGSITVTLTASSGSAVGSRNRSEPPEADNGYLNNLYKDLFFVQYTMGNGLGLDYIQLGFSGLEADKPYEFTIFNWDAFYTPANEETKYMAWGLESPRNYPQYQPLVGGGGKAPKITRILMSGADPCDPNILDPFYYSGSFTARSDSDGNVILYAWTDNEDWEGSAHAPINGFAIGIDPNANIPSPADEQTEVDMLLTTLSWGAGFWAQDANAHYVYFGTDYTEVSDADTDTAGIYLGNPTDSSITLPAALLSNQTYYWRVDEVNDACVPGYWKGHVWEFTTAALTLTKCTVKAGKTQYADQGPCAGDVNELKDSFVFSGRVVFPADLNDITQIEVNIISTTDDEVVYWEAIDFNAANDVVKNKFKYSYKILKGTEGAITSMKLDFARNTVALKAKNIDLTGLRSPFDIDLIMGSATLKGEADETIINKRKLVPTRLMRLYEDTLVVTKTKVRDSSRVSSDSLSVKGEIAIKEMDLDVNEPNLADANTTVTLTWSSTADTNAQTFEIPGSSFTATKKGHSYKCSKVVMDTNDCNQGIVNGKFDFDKCTFTLTVKGAEDLYTGPETAKVGISIANDYDDVNDFDEAVEINYVTGRSY